MEIERKFLIRQLPENLSAFPSVLIQQAYLCTDPVIRIRRQNEDFYLTYKGKGLMSREEYNLPLNREAYQHLLSKADGNIITKRRYLIPIEHPGFKPEFVPNEKIDLQVELDLFDPPFAPLIIAEVEFPSREMAEAFLPLDWFKEDVTEDPAYHNSNLSRRDLKS